MSDSSRWSEIKGILADALELPEADRQAFIAARCGDDSDLRAAVDAMLATPSAFMLRPALEAVGGARHEDADELLPPGTALGPYRIADLIGRGGMGQVYRATRADGEFSQQVAIKIIRREMAGGSVLQRFRTERQILASLHHPSIAALLDGGTAPDGRPYFVMELVDGAAIDDYCNARQLSVRDRVRLLFGVCDAVHYAHQHLVVHRDLKPRNILVTADGAPKLLDFGIAKLLSPDAEGAAPLTSIARPMTPEYASPEQVRGEPVTTTTDVYALGVVLYELLTGQRPHRGAGSTLALMDAIANQDPAAPSTVAAPESRRLLAGDLDAIVMTALRKEPHRRYGSVQKLADDLQRYLDGRPVTAQADSRRYRASKFVRRHRVAVAAAVLAFVALAAGAAVATWQAAVANRERARAEQRFADVRKLSNSLVFEINQALDGGPVKARELLVERGREYLEKLVADAGGDAALRHEIATAYNQLANIYGLGTNQSNLGRREEGIAMLKRSVDMREAIERDAPFAENRRELAEAYVGLSRYESAQGRPQAALPHLQRAIVLLESTLVQLPDDDKTLQYLAVAHHEAGSVLDAGTAGAATLGRPQEALEHYTKGASYGERRVARNPTADRRQILATLYGELANWHAAQGKTDQELVYGDKAIALLESNVREHPASVLYRRELAIVYSNMGMAQRRANKLPEGLDYVRKSLALFQAVADADPNDATNARTLAVGHRNLGLFLDLNGRSAEALGEFDRATSMLRGLIARDPGNAFLERQLAQTHLNAAGALQTVRGPEAALRELRFAIDICESLVAKDAGNATAWRTLARAHAQAGRASRAAAERGAAGRWRNARDSYARSIQGWLALQKTMNGTLPPADAGQLDLARKQLAEIEAAIRRRRP